MNKECTIYKTMDFVGKRWTLLILLELYKGGSRWKRYSRIKKNLTEITPKVLSLRLKELADENLIIKKVDARNFPIKSENSLTSSGNDFINIIKDIKKWSLRWKIKNKICNNSDCQDCVL